MSLDTRTRKAVCRRLERLREEHGSFPLTEETVTNDPEYFEHGVALAEEGWIGDAGAFVTDDAGRTLLIRHAGAPDRWGTPGSGHEPGERLSETARREVREETGVDCAITGVYWARHKTIVHADDPDRRLYSLTIEFEADYVDGEIAIGDEEIVDARWFAEPADAVHGFLEAKIEEWRRET